MQDFPTLRSRADVRSDEYRSNHDQNSAVLEKLDKATSQVDINLTTFKIRHEEQMEKLDTYLGN